MDSAMKRKILIRSFIAAIVFAIPFFFSGTVNYWQAWAFIVSFIGGLTWHSLYLRNCAPELWERRMRAGPTEEKRMPQRIIMTVVLISFVVLFVFAGIDHRNGWSNLPTALVLGADLLLILSFLIFNKVCHENAFASATIELAPDQQVISTGPYALVRHPMYSGALLLTFAMPLSLGTLWGSGILLVVMPALIWRIMDEEKMLKEELSGYSDYCQKVKYRLIPGIY